MLSRNYLSMVNHCEWCKGEIRDKRTKLCSGCRLLSPGFIGTDISPFLSYRRNIDTNQILAPARGLSDGQRIKHLTQEVDLRIPIPPILRSKRKGGLNSINYDPNDWKKMKDYWDRFGSIRRGNYFFPDGSFLTVNNNGVFHINGQQLTGNLPILDIAEWLSNPLRSESIRFWDELILLLDCTMTKLPIAYRNEEDWAIWVDENSWRGIDYPWKTARTFPPPTSRIPPFLQYIYEKNKSKYFDGEKLTINKLNKFFINDFFTTTTDYSLNEESYSLFGQLTYNGIDSIGIHLGLRGDQYDKSLNRNAFGLSGPVPNINESSDYSFISPRAGIDFELSDSSLIYLNSGIAYKSGGYSAFIDNPELAQFNEEQSWTKEIGLKKRWLDDKVRTNFAIFHNNIDDYQVERSLVATDYAILNADEARSYGAEIELSAEIFSGITLEGSLGKTTTELTNYIDPISGSNLSGNKAPFVPELDASLAVNYSHDSGVFARVELVHQGEVYFNDQNNSSFMEKLFN